MQCPHCSINFHDNWDENNFKRGVDPLFCKTSQAFWFYRTAECPNCDNLVIEIASLAQAKAALNIYAYHEKNWRRVYPKTGNRGPIHKTIPEKIAGDYSEACHVLSISPKASAALSRRCLQNILRDNGYCGRDLASEIDLVLAEPDPKKALTSSLRETIDGIRNFGNFSAHPIDDKTTLQIIDVEPHEAEWCLEIIEELFDHFYIKPSVAREKKAALDAKLAAAGKPPSKG